jgi:pilus assembly protein CpaB
MKASRYVVVGIAAIAAILLAFLVRGLVGGKPSNPAKATSVAVAPPVQTVKILVAAHALKAGTRITDSDLTWQDWPQNLLNPAYIVDTNSAPQTPINATEGGVDAAHQVATKAASTAQQVVNTVVSGSPKTQFIGGVVRENILANEPIIETKIVRADKGGFLAVMLEPGQRAMAVPISVESTAGGFILPGDHVDIIATVSVPRSGGGNSNYITPILSNIKVLAIDQQVQSEENKQSVIGATATLAVTPKEAEVLAMAKASGSLSLTLRSYADVSGASGITAYEPRGSNNASENQSVQVYRNGQSTQVAVTR